MRKSILRVFAAALAVFMLVPALAGCKKDGDSGQTAETPEFVYIPEYIELPESVTDMSNLNVVGDKIYFSSYSLVDEAEGIYQTTLFSVGIDGTGLSQLSGYVRPTVPEGSNGEYNIVSMCADPDGNLWVVENGYFYHYDKPADFDPETDNEWDYYVDDGSSVSVRKLDSTGAELMTMDISALSNNNESLYVGAMKVDNANNIYISDGNMTVYVLGPDGKLQFKVEASDWINTLVRMSDGTVAASGYMEGGFSVKKIDPAARAWGEALELPYNVYNIYEGGGDYACTYGDGSNLYGMNAATGEAEKLLNWINCDINNDGVGNINILPDGRVLCTNNTWTDMSNSFELVILTKTPYSSVEQKTIFTLATMYLDYNLRNAIIDFNKTDPNYRIQVNDYSEYNTEDNYTAGLTKLSTEIISGKVPDILDVSGLPVAQYAAKGLMEDLYPYIEGDADISLEDFIPSVAKVLESDGKLYQICASFSVNTLIGDPDVVGAETGWTMEEFQSLLAKNPQADLPFGQNYTKNDFLNYAMVMGMDQYVDWSTGKCSFDTGDFAKVLEFANSFPEEYNYDEDNYVSEYQLIQDGRQLVTNFYAGDFQSIQMYKAMFGGKMVFKGFPTSSGSGNVISTGTGLAMSTKCADKEGAWKFIRTILTEDWQTKNVTWNYPTNQKVFDEMLKKAMTPEYTTDENGNQVEVSQGSWGMDGLEVEIKALTQEEADQIKALINSVSGTMKSDESMLNIIKEEASAFFAGQKSAEDAARIIQDRVSTYVAEQS